jgi:hypothetical protein
MSENLRSSTKVRRRKAADYIQEVHGQKVSPQTLARFACNGGGPEMIKLKNGDVLYETDALDDWCRSRLAGVFNSTAEMPPIYRRPPKDRSNKAGTNPKAGSLAGRPADAGEAA